MAGSNTRFIQLRWLHTVVCIAAILGAVILIGLGIVGVGVPKGNVNPWLIVVGAILIFSAVSLMTVMPIIFKMESMLARQLDELRDISEALTSHEALLQTIAENTRISDGAKSLAHREQELDALRSVIREDLRTQNWDAASNLIEEMERRFGFKEEAETFREELDDARNEAIEAKLCEAIEMIESHFQTFDWDLAQSEIDRLIAALPNHGQVMSLMDRMSTLKEKHKNSLMQGWEEAVRRNDTDKAIDILRELDQYLSPSEAEALQSSARHVFKEKLLLFGVQFRFAVNEKRWQDALSIGLELVREFPNARMASEVREALDTLRERARESAEGDAEALSSVPR